MGNILKIIDKNGEDIVKYVYDAWGNHAVLNPDGTENTSSTFIGNINPFRYRGYYYDTETGLYFLKTRYYDPEIGRFITIDSIEYIDPDTINGLNLYAYCGNNPVMNVDSNGTSWNSFWRGVGNLFVRTGKTVLNGVTKVANAVWDGMNTVATTVWNGLVSVGTAIGNFFSDYGALIGSGLLVLGIFSAGVIGSLFTGGLLSAVLLGAGIGCLTGFAGNAISQISQKGLKNFNALSALTSGGIGAIIGAISGTLSFGFGEIAQAVGRMAGNYISQMTICGLNVGKAFAYLGGAGMLASVGGIAGNIIGGLFGGAFANKLANNLFGINPSFDENMTEGANGTIIDYIMQFFRWMLR